MKRGNFKIKSGYFEDLEGEIMSKIALDPKQDFRVPKSYFEDLDHEIKKKLKQKSTKIITLSKLISVAASIAIAAVVFWPSSVLVGDFDLNTNIAYLNEEDFESYSQEIYSSIDLGGQTFDLNLDNLNEDEVYLTEELIEELYNE